MIAPAQAMVEGTPALARLGKVRHEKLAQQLVNEPFFDELAEIYATPKQDLAPDKLDKLAARIVQEGDMEVGRDKMILFSGPGMETAEKLAAARPDLGIIHGTSAGAALEIAALYGEKSPLSFEQATRHWDDLSQRLAAECQGGTVYLCLDQRHGSSPDSTFRSVELNLLQRHNDDVRKDLKIQVITPEKAAAIAADPEALEALEAIATAPPEIRKDQKLAPEAAQAFALHDKDLAAWRGYTTGRLDGNISRQGLYTKPRADGSSEGVGFIKRKPASQGAGGP